MPSRQPLFIGLALTLLLTCLTLRPTRAVAMADAVLDAKRKAAAQLLKDGRPADALALMNEVTAADDTLYADHLLIARAHDKLGHAADALRHYKRVLELASANAQSSDERQARQEADKRIKQLDPQGGKIDAAVDEYLRKLDALEREAVAGRNMIALERVFRLRGLTWQAERWKDHAFAEVFANSTWQPAGLEVKAGQSYRVRAAGSWRVKGTPRTPLIDCTAAGTKERTERDFAYTPGSLLGNVNGKFVQLGEDAVFTAPASGALLLIESDPTAADRAKNSGSLQVLIAAQ